VHSCMVGNIHQYLELLNTSSLLLLCALQIALQQQLFAAARMRSQNMDAAAAAAVAAAYGQGPAAGTAAGAAPE